VEEDSGQDGADHASEKGGDFDQGRVSCALAWPSVPVEEPWVLAVIATPDGMEVLIIRFGNHMITENV